MKNTKILVSILLAILIFLNLKSTVSASIFDDDWLGEDKKSEIETTIDKDEGGLFEKIIAKMIGGLAETVFDLTTNEKFKVRF